MSANELLSASVLDLKTVRVLFGNGGSPAYSVDLASVLSGSYFIALIGGLPSYVPTVVSVVGFESNGTGYHGATITFDQETTPGSSYRLTVNDITGIPFNGTDNVADFEGAALSFPAERAFDLWDHIPEINKAEDTAEELENFIACAQEVLNLLVTDVDRWIEILDSDLAPENFVDLMLSDLGNPFLFSDPLSLVEKRRLVNALVSIYKLKGTTLGVQTAIQFFMGMKSEIIRLDGLGNKLSAFIAYGPSFGFSGRLSAQINYGMTAVTTFKLGSKRRWRFLLKVGTTERSQIAAEAPVPVAGGPLTAKQIDQIKRILEIMKPAYMILVQSGEEKQTGLEPSRRNGIRRNPNYSIDLIMEHILNASQGAFWESGDNGVFGSPSDGSPGVNEFNTTATQAITLSTGDLMIAEDVIPKLRVEYNFDTSSFATSDPGSGNLRLDTFDPSDATSIIFSETDALSISWFASYLNQFDLSIGVKTVYARLRLKSNANKWAVYKVTADTLGSGWRFYTATYQGSTLTGTDLASGPRVYLEVWVDIALYWNGIGVNTFYNTTGLLGNEITNALKKPTVVATPGTGKITLSWAADPDVTAWRIYRSSSTAGVTTDADNSTTPIEISGDLSSYIDLQESGTTKHYMVSPMKGDSEGFMSDEVSATAT